MKLYFTSGATAGLQNINVFQSCAKLSEVYVPRSLLSDELLGNYMILNPSWKIIVVEDGGKTPHTCYMILNESTEASLYK